MKHPVPFPLLPGYKIGLKSLLKKVSTNKRVYAQSTQYTVASIHNAPPTTTSAVDSKMGLQTKKEL